MTVLEALAPTVTTSRGEPLVPIFVYGTLRKGQGNYSLCAPAVRFVYENCTTNGKIYFVSRGGGYPVAKLNEEGTIKGDVLWFDPTCPEYDEILRMELGAGYDLQEVTVRDADGDEGTAYAFHYRHDPRGELIPNGDWVAAENARWPSQRR